MEQAYEPSLEHFTDIIEDVRYYTFEGTTTTVCCLILNTGDTLVGSNALTIKECRANREIGEKIALRDALATLCDYEYIRTKHEHYLEIKPEYR